MYSFFSFWMFSVVSFFVGRVIGYYSGKIIWNKVILLFTFLLSCTIIGYSYYVSGYDQTNIQLISSILVGVIIGIFNKKNMTVVIISVLMAVGTLVGYDIYQTNNIPKTSNDLNKSFSSMMRESKINSGVDIDSDYLDKNGEVVIPKYLDSEKPSSNENSFNSISILYNSTGISYYMYKHNTSSSPYVKYALDDAYSKMYEHPDSWKYITFYKGDSGYIHRLNIGNKWANYYVVKIEKSPLMREYEYVMDFNTDDGKNSHYNLLPATPCEWGGNPKDIITKYNNFDEKFSNKSNRKSLNNIAKDIAENKSISEKSMTYADFLKLSNPANYKTTKTNTKHEKTVNPKIKGKQARKIAEDSIDMNEEKYMSTQYNEESGIYYVYFKGTSVNAQQPDSVSVDGKNGKVLKIFIQNDLPENAQNISKKDSGNSQTSREDLMSEDSAKDLAMAKFYSVERNLTDGFSPHVSDIKDNGNTYSVIISDTPTHIISYTVDKTSRAVFSDNGM